MYRIFLFATAFLAGCGSTGTGGLVTTGRSPTTTQVSTAAGTYEVNAVTESRVSSHWVRVPIDRVWTVLPEVYSELGIEAGVINPAARQFGNPDMVANTRLAGERISRYLECGENAVGAPIADTYRIDMNLVSKLEAQADGTRVRTTLQAQATPRAVSGGPTHCMSTGELEKRIAELVSARVES